MLLMSVGEVGEEVREEIKTEIGIAPTGFLRVIQFVIGSNS